MTWLAAIALSFLCGSIPFGVLIARAKGVDIRAHGSKNIGATNVGRVLGRPLGILCFLLDALKGFVPTAGAGMYHGIWGEPAAALPATTQWLWLAVAIAALLGHMFSPWIGFRGGKGVATGFGALVGMWPVLTLAALAALVVWIVVVAAMRIVSIASVVAGFVVPAAVAFQVSIGVPVGVSGGVAPEATGDSLDALRATAPILITTLLLAALIGWKHRANLARLVRGEEPRIGRRGVEAGRTPVEPS